MFSASLVSYLLMISSCTVHLKHLRFTNSLLNCLTKLKQWFSDNSLQLNSDKTKTLIIAPDSAIPNIKQHFVDLRLSAKTKLRNLGVIFDEAMSLEHHSRQLVKNCIFQLHNVAKLMSNKIFR